MGAAHRALACIGAQFSAQRLRFEDGGRIVDVPDGVVGHETAPMGRKEMVIYFDPCRELIAAAWSWRENGETKRRLGTGEDCRPALAEFLRGVKVDWLESPFEGGSPPSFIIECSRRRVPRGASVPIVGMSEREAEEQLYPDCPVCKTMADGRFGVAFAGLDGHHLKLDDEFAFSMHETREAWEQEQHEFEERSAAFERCQAEREAAGEAESDEFASVWSGHVSDEPIPGDPRGYLRLALLLGEIVSTLESLNAPHPNIHQLNANFADFHSCDAAERAESGRRLRGHLETLAERYSNLTPRVADFCNRIDECLYFPAIEDDEDELEFPF